MQQVTLTIGTSGSYQYIYSLNNEKIKYLLKFVHSICDESEQDKSLMKEIEIGLKQVKKMRDGMLPKKTLKQMLSGK